MAHVEDRWYRTVPSGDGGARREKTPLFGKGLRYRVRYIDPQGRERSKSFPDRQKRAAEDFLVTIESDKRRGNYIDPAAGRVTFAEYATEWLSHQTFDESTREVTERRLRRHILPLLGSHELAAIRPTHLKEFDRALQVKGLSATYRAVARSNVATILNSAVDDDRIAKNPSHARALRRRPVVIPKVIPWTPERVFAVRAALPSRYTVALDLGAGCGLRQGEILALGVDGLDYDRKVIHVVRQVKIVANRLVFALPKGRKTRDVPLPSIVADRVAEHMAAVPPLAVTLPWETPDGRPVTAELVMPGKTGVALDRNMFNRNVWWPAATSVGVPKERENGMHALRHYYASVLLDAGESIKALAAYLGHSDPGFTLRTYTHLMPTSEDRTRRALDRALGQGPDGPDHYGDDDGLATA